VEVMAHVASMVVGIVVHSVVLELGLIGLGSPRLVFSTISGVLALSTIMVPFVARTSEEALRLVPIAVRESSLALGIPRYRTILRVVVPSASSALVTGGLLGIARVAGETAPLLVTAFGSNDWFRGLDQPIESLPHTIYVWATGPYVAQNQAAWGVSLVLVVVIVGLTIVSLAVCSLRSVSRGVSDGDEAQRGIALGLVRREARDPGYHDGHRGPHGDRGHRSFRLREVDPDPMPQPDARDDPEGEGRGEGSPPGGGHLRRVPRLCSPPNRHGGREGPPLADTLHATHRD